MGWLLGIHLPPIKLFFSTWFFCLLVDTENCGTLRDRVSTFFLPKSNYLITKMEFWFENIKVHDAITRKFFSLLIKFFYRGSKIKFWFYKKRIFVIASSWLFYFDQFNIFVNVVQKHSMLGKDIAEKKKSHKNFKTTKCNFENTQFQKYEQLQKLQKLLVVVTD